MRKLLQLFIGVCVLLAGANIPPAAWAQTPIILDPQVFDWLKSNISPITHLPYSFYVPRKDRSKIYGLMGSAESVKGSIERMITHEGMDIYDGAVYQIVLAMAGGRDNLDRASLVDRYYWQGAVGDTWNIRAGYPINTFIYDPKHPDRVSSDNNRFGKRGFIFRIIDADGNYLVTDPLDGNKYLPGFPDGSRLHWVDWKPVAGENAWVVIAAMQLYHKKPDSIELKLSQELARAAMILQSPIGGIRMAPLGTDRTLSKAEAAYFTAGDWWYNHISTENNISWYAAFRMLYQITGQVKYKHAMEGIQRYLRFVWDPQQGYFAQGAYCINGRWVKDHKNFALDVQTWSIACLGPEKLDAWFGPGAAWRIWQAGRRHSGVFDKQGGLLGVGYTDEHDRISVEWSAGAMVALMELFRYYQSTDPARAARALRDKDSMRRSMEGLHYDISPTLAAYSYSSRRGWIPFGWNSHDPRVMSLASSGWMLFVDAGFNPFWLL
ncbi:MAG: hypothetical protein KGJ09_07540 [Candidatus Omnitrophica bacterium]|nr:hypothetical protein [Candidatus Omnitrophota bacterium]